MNRRKRLKQWRENTHAYRRKKMDKGAKTASFLLDAGEFAALKSLTQATGRSQREVVADLVVRASYAVELGLPTITAPTHKPEGDHSNAPDE